MVLVLNQLLLMLPFCLFNLGVVASGKAELFNTQSFQHIRSSSYPHFVMFFAPWCGHCKKIQSLWDVYAEESEKSRRLKVAKIDCTVNTPLCATENIKAYPTLRLYSDHQKFTYRGYRSLNSFGEFVEKNVKNLKDGQVPTDSDSKKATKDNKPNVEFEDNTPVKAKMLTQDTFETETSERYAFVDFYAPWCPHCRDLEPTWNQLATRFKHDKRVVIAKVDCTADPDLCRRERINAYPMLRMYKKGAMIEQYDGGRNLASLVEFIEAFTSGELINEGQEEPRVPVAVSPGEFRFRIKTRSQLVYFENSVFTSSNENKQKFELAMKEINGFTENVEGVFIDCLRYNDFCEQMKVTGFPSIVYFKTMGERYRYNANYEVKSIVKFIEKLERKGKKDEL